MDDTYLVQRIQKSLEGALAVGEMTVSMIGGSKKEGGVAYLDLQCALSTYRSWIEIVSLVDIHTNLFPDAKLYDSVKRKLELNLSQFEVVMNNMLKHLVEANFP